MEYKGLKIVNKDGWCFIIKQLGSGAVPKALSGYYTSVRDAKIAIDTYQPRRGAKALCQDKSNS